MCQNGFLLNLIFAGLVAFAPNRELDPPGLTVFMLGTSERQFASDGCALHSHKAAFAYEKRNFAGNCEDEADLADESVPICSLNLARHQVTLDIN